MAKSLGACRLSSQRWRGDVERKEKIEELLEYMAELLRQPEVPEYIETVRMADDLHMDPREIHELMQTVAPGMKITRRHRANGYSTKAFFAQALRGDRRHTERHTDERKRAVS